MNKQTEALTLALDWFRCYADKSMSRNNAEALADEVVDAITKALAQPSDSVEQEPEVCCGDYATCMKPCTPRGRWLAQQEPVAPEGWKLVPVKPTLKMIDALADTDPERKSVWDAVLEGAPPPPQRQSQPEQEPVQYKCTVIDNHHPNGIPFEQWVKPKKREWVDLTEQEALDCFSPNPVTHRKNIAAKLKEKNT